MHSLARNAIAYNDILIVTPESSRGIGHIKSSIGHQRMYLHYQLGS